MGPHLGQLLRQAGGGGGRRVLQLLLQGLPLAPQPGDPLPLSGDAAPRLGQLLPEAVRLIQLRMRLLSVCLHIYLHSFDARQTHVRLKDATE